MRNSTADRHAIGKEAKESAGSIFQPDSLACHAALNALSVVLKQVGFLVDKKRDSESTLRVYLRERLKYPLLNPRFSAGRFEVWQVVPSSRSPRSRMATRGSPPAFFFSFLEASAVQVRR
jgi:hypothetical protein